MKINELLRETSEVEFEFDMMERLLKKDGFSPVRAKNTRSLTIMAGFVPDGSKSPLGVEVFPISFAEGDVRWFVNFFFASDLVVHRIAELSFNDVVPKLKDYLKKLKITEEVTYAAKLCEMDGIEFELDMMEKWAKKHGFDVQRKRFGFWLKSAQKPDAPVLLYLVSEEPSLWAFDVYSQTGSVTKYGPVDLSFEDVIPALLKCLRIKSKVGEGVEYDPAFKMLDGTNPAKPYTQKEIMAAMKQLHARIERQAADYGNKVDRKTGKLLKTSKFHDAQIAADE